MAFVGDEDGGALVEGFVGGAEAGDATPDDQDVGGELLGFRQLHHLRHLPRPSEVTFDGPHGTKRLTEEAGHTILRILHIGFLSGVVEAQHVLGADVDAEAAAEAQRLVNLFDNHVFLFSVLSLFLELGIMGCCG